MLKQALLVMSYDCDNGNGEGSFGEYEEHWQDIAFEERMFVHRECWLLLSLIVAGFARP